MPYRIDDCSRHIHDGSKDYTYNRRATDAKRLSIRVPKVSVDRHQIQQSQEMPAVPSDAETLHGGTSSKEPCPCGCDDRYGHAAELAEQERYTRPVDAIVTSPPFQDQEPAQDKAWLAAHAHEITSNERAGVQFGPAMNQGYALSNSTNIGNLRNAAYWEAMRQEALP